MEKEEFFCTSSQDLKQGDPLSPFLFINEVEVFSRLLNNLHYNDSFNPFSMNPNGPLIKHLAYADDIVIFTSGNNMSIGLVLKQVRRYERASRQKITKDKSSFTTTPNSCADRTNRMRMVI